MSLSYLLPEHSHTPVPVLTHWTLLEFRVQNLKLSNFPRKIHQLIEDVTDLSSQREVEAKRDTVRGLSAAISYHVLYNRNLMRRHRRSLVRYSAYPVPRKEVRPVALEPAKQIGGDVRINGMSRNSERIMLTKRVRRVRKFVRKYLPIQCRPR